MTGAPTCPPLDRPAIPAASRTASPHSPDWRAKIAPPAQRLPARLPAWAALMARDLVLRDEAVAALLGAMLARAPGLDVSGTRVRLAHALQAEAEAARRARHAAGARVAARVAPLLDAWAEPGVLLAAARAAAADWLDADECRALVQAGALLRLSRDGHGLAGRDGAARGGKGRSR